MGITEPSRRRVSYVLPAPKSDTPIITLPPFGTVSNTRSFPLLDPKPLQSEAAGSPNGQPTPKQFASRNPFASPPAAPGLSLSPTLSLGQFPNETDDFPHPRHRLGITSLALDTSTLLSGADSPGGILYTGGRDGLVASWELHVPHTRRRGRRYRTVNGRGTSCRVKWERVGDGGANWDDEEDEHGELGEQDGESSSDEEDGPGGPETNGTVGRKKRETPYEDRWEVDHNAIRTQPPPVTTFRESFQTHVDWVNAMVLCNMNQTVITASSDRTIRAWSPHMESPDDEATVPALIGHHTDYVRALAFARHPGVLFSGSLDRDISIWDITSPRPNEPVLKVRLSDIEDHGGVGLEGEWGSIYALGVDPAGRTLAAGTPERVVRLWDPRAGDRNVTKLVGHTDCVRSIVLSDDGRYMLTGSSDTTVKLWSVGEHRCLHTFNHHTSSVWSLFSNHPNLERFYTGSRDGHLCVVDVEQCGDMSEGECVVLAREGDANQPGDYESKTGDDAIRSIVGMDDEYVWTATSRSDVHRWRDVGRRVNRLDMDLDGASYGDQSRLLDDEAQPAQVQFDPTFEPTSIIGNNAQRGKNQAIGGYGMGDPLVAVDPRESRTIAFAPDVGRASPALGPATPSGAISALPTGVRERLSLSGGPGSSQSVASLISETGTDGNQAEVFLRNGVSYDSQVCLGLPDSPYSFGFTTAAYSNASLTSNRQGPEIGAPSVPERAPPPRVAARRAFEDRDVAAEATPLRAEPDNTIAGSPGLIRALILNDRLHVLAIDTQGEVTVWHLVRGACVGRFDREEVAEALKLEHDVPDVGAEIKLHPQEVLELVQRRVEGKNSVLPWCQVDTKVGQITVHLEGDRVFAADILAEELGIDERTRPDDQKALNVGKAVLGNLFGGLIKAEELEIGSTASLMGTSPTSQGSSSILSRSPAAPTFISIERASLASPRHRQRALSSSSSMGMTPSINIAGLATRASTRAVVPDGASVYGQSAPVSSDWLSLSLGKNTAPVGTSPFNASSPMFDNPATRDYFSLRSESTPTKEKEEKPSGSTPIPPSPSGGSLLGKKFKGFGKKKAVETPMSTLVESKREDNAHKDKGPETNERDKQQLVFLDALRSRPFRPPTSLDAPFIGIPDSTAVIISEQASADSSYIVTYRSQVSSTERDMEPLEMNSPYWLLNFLFTSSIPEERRPPKIPIILVPEGQAPGTGKGFKVQTSRTARVRGVLDHLQNVILHEDHSSGRDRTFGEPGARAEDVLELLCGKHIADPNMKVGTLKHYFWRGGVEMVLHYRRKAAS